jgi:transposase
VSNSHSSRSNARRTDALLAPALASGLSYSDVALRFGVSERTVKRRMADPAFRTSVVALQEQVARDTAAQLRELSRTALGALQDLLREDCTPNIRLGAVRTVLEHALRWQESVMLEERLGRLEHTVMTDGQGHSA